MHIAMIGTRGVPARYGGFETAVEEIGCRLAAAGHEVTVFCRGGRRSDGERPAAYLGMRLVWLPAMRRRSLETLSHTALSVVHAVLRSRPDVAFVFNAANAPFVPLLQAAGVQCALHTDGLEWQRGKWGRAGRRYYLRTERLGARRAHALISDHAEISRYYRDRYGRASTMIEYGADVISPSAEGLASLGLTSGEYFLAVARLEPENHVDVIIEGFRRTALSGDAAERPLVVIGDATYRTAYHRDLLRAAEADPRVRMVGALWDERIDALYAHAALYLHGHSVGGTNPSLLRAMGAAAPVAAWDVEFNRYVLGEPPARCLFSSPDEVAAVLVDAARDPEFWALQGKRNQQRVADHYRWDAVAEAYEALARSLASSS
jgi:glycosyltransferase involved in cell wall biosynthesis